jgi:hypothetical protein
MKETYLASREAAKECPAASRLVLHAIKPKSDFHSVCVTCDLAFHSLSSSQ